MSISIDEGKREFRRFYVFVTAGLSIGTIECRALVRDVSRRGLFVIIDDAFPVGTSCNITFVQTDVDRGIEVTGEVVRVDNEGMAIKFSKLLPHEDVDLLNSTPAL